MLVDVLRYDTPGGGDSYRACDAGSGRAIVDAHRGWNTRQRSMRLGLLVVLGVVVAGYGVLVLQRPLLSLLGIVALAGIAVVGRGRLQESDPVPELVEESVRLAEARERYDLDVRPS